MSFFSLIALRNFLLKRYAYFSCCASCGDIRIPLENRLCTSLVPDFPVDIVLLSDKEENSSAENLKAALVAVKTYLPWARRIWLSPSQMTTDFETQGVGALRSKEEAEALQRERVGQSSLPEYLLHLAEGIADYFIVIRSGFIICRPYICLDFFTPNGIPLLFATSQTDFFHKDQPVLLAANMEAQGGGEEPLLRPLAGLYAQTKENSTAFADVYERSWTERAPAPDYCLSLTQWTYATARAVLSAEAHSARMHAHVS